MSQSRSGKLNPDLEGLELFFNQNGGSASFGTKMAQSLNGVDPGCMNPIIGSTCKVKWSNILHDTLVNVTVIGKHSSLIQQGVITGVKWFRTGAQKVANFFGGVIFEMRKIRRGAPPLSSTSCSKIASFQKYLFWSLFSYLRWTNQ